jgi:YidC/Oxa1 family membrane protein insertase
MERRVLLAVFLSFLVLYAYQALFVTPPQAPETATAPAAAPGGTPPATPAPGGAATPDTGGTAAVPPAVAAEPVAAVAAPTVSEATAREIVVDTGVVQAVFSNEGATLTGWRVLDHFNDAGEPLDLVPPTLVDGQPTPFTLTVDDAALTGRLTSGVYRVTGDTGGRVDATTAPATVVFEYRDAAGLAVRKTFAFEPQGYVVAFSASVTVNGQTLNPAVRWGPGLSEAGAAPGGGLFNYTRPPAALYYLADGVERLAFGDLTAAPVYEGNFRYAGINDHYFIAAALDTGPARVAFGAAPLPSGTGEPLEMIDATFMFDSPPDGVRFYLGPKQFDLLQGIDAEFVRAIDFGFFFAWLVVPLLGALNWIYGVVGNYGWAIIWLTIAINLVIFPLRHKSVVSMRKMQGLQPRMKAIQERYKDLKVTDPARQKMNTEIMDLYREEGVNPASGCVPMLLTMPVLIAFYSMLSGAIELRDAPFMLWIQDLSLRDPYYILPAMMGGAMFWQQRISPTTADPTQQRVMMIMPFMFVGFMAVAPAGLVIYWFVSNIWMIGQQYFTNWILGKPASPRPPAERQLKKAGSGRTKGAEAGSAKESS